MKNLVIAGGLLLLAQSGARGLASRERGTFKKLVLKSR
jgi:hypothetical protein